MGISKAGERLLDAAKEPGLVTAYAEAPPPETNYIVWEDEQGAAYWEAIIPICLPPQQKLRRLCSYAELIEMSPIPLSIRQRIASMRRSRSPIRRLYDRLARGRGCRE